MTTLNAYDEQVQLFINTHKNRNNKNYSNERMKQLQQYVQQKGYVFEQLFPIKQYNVLTQLLIKLSQTGITKIAAETLAVKAECGVATVYNAVKSIKATEQIVVARLKSRGKNNGFYIFVDKLHANFKAIMHDVFSLDNQAIKELDIVPFIGLDNSENVDTSALDGDFEGAKGFKDFKNLKQAINNYNVSDKDAIKDEIENQKSETPEQQRELLNTYATNEYQIAFFDFIHTMPYPKIVSDSAYKLALRIGSNCTINRFMQAKDVLQRLVMDIIEDGLQVGNFVATFTGALVNYESYPVIQDAPKKSASPSRKVIFYNWLEESE